MLGCAQDLAKTTGPVSAPEERGNDPEAVYSGHRPVEFNSSATGAGRAKPHLGQLGESAPAHGGDHPRRVQGLNRLGCLWSLKNRPHRYFRTKLGDSLIRESLRVHDQGITGWVEDRYVFKRIPSYLVQHLVANLHRAPRFLSQQAINAVFF